MGKQKIIYHYPLPQGLEIEPTNLCDLKCPLCPAGNGKIEKWGIPRGMMTLEQFKGIVDQTKKIIKYIVLWGLGEPTLVPDLDKMISYASKNKILVITSIHANNLKHNENIRLIKAKPYKIIFAIDGLCQQTYKIYRRGGNYKKAYNNLVDCIKIKKKIGQKYPLIYWQFLLMNHNEHEVPGLIERSKEIGVDGLMLKKYTSGVEKFAPQDPKYNRNEPKEKKYECKFLKERPMIFFNGDVSVCSHDFKMKYIVGNIFKEKFVDLWNNNRFTKFRQNYYKDLIPECNTCRSRLYDDHFIEYKF